jgi:hypothetical protein
MASSKVWVLGDIESHNKKGRAQRFGSGRRIAQLKLENVS